MFWQGATTLRATARKEKQRRQSAPGRLNRVRSVVTQKVNSFVSTEVSVHAALQAEVSGQLRFLGLYMWNRGAWVGMGYKAVFAANIGNICKKINTVDRPSQVITNRAE